MPPDNAPLERLAELSGSSTPRAFVWHPADSDAGVSVHDGGLQQWKIDGGSAEVMTPHIPTWKHHFPGRI